MLNFYDYRPTADLSGNIQISLKLDLLQHHRAVADLCMFHYIGNNFANIVTPTILTHPRSVIVVMTIFNLLIQMLLNTKFLSEVLDFGTSFIAKLRCSLHLDFTITEIQARIPGALFNPLPCFALFLLLLLVVWSATIVSPCIYFVFICTTTETFPLWLLILIGEIN